MAQETNPPEKVREIFVPFKDLNVLLENQPRRVLLLRQDYDDLVKQAKIAPARHVPQSAVLTSADYEGRSDGQRVRMAGTLSIDVLEKGLHALPLDLGGVGLLSAKLDEHDAPIGRTSDGRLSLLVEGVGPHTLLLDMVAPLETTSARQMLFLRLPRGGAGRLRLSVPGDVELRGGANLSSRVLDPKAGVTRFELLPTVGDATLVMSLNSHLQGREQAVVAASVLVDEVTAAYEKLHATVSLEILYRAVDRFRFVVPEGFEITEIASPLLARWDVQTEGGRKIANVRLREQTTETVVLNISAVRVPAPLAPEKTWQFPQWEPLDVEGHVHVEGHVAVLGLLAEEPLKAEAIQPEGLIPIDTAVLSLAMPAGAGSRAGGPGVAGRGRLLRPAGPLPFDRAVCQAAGRAGRDRERALDPRGRRTAARGGWAMLPDVEKRFSFDFTLPAGWQIVSLTGPDRQPLAFERYEAPGKTPRVHVRLPRGIPPGEEYRVFFHAVRTPPGWLADWKTQAVEFPAFSIPGASRDEGRPGRGRPRRHDRPRGEARSPRAVGRERNGQVRPGRRRRQSGLSVRQSAVRACVGGRATTPRLTARTFSCFQVLPEGLTVHDVLVYQVEDARTRRLALELPRGTPDKLKIVGLGGTKVMEFVPEPDKPHAPVRRWNVLLADASSRRGPPGGRFPATAAVVAEGQGGAPGGGVEGQRPASAAARDRGGHGLPVAGGACRRRGLSVGPGFGGRQRGVGRAGQDRRPPR